MTELEKLKQWLSNHPREDIPFWPGADFTGNFGLRASQTLLNMGASLLHLGTDRAGYPQPMPMPFDGRYRWRLAQYPAGSVLRYVPDDLDLEIQVFHTVHPDSDVTEIENHAVRGERIPVKPGSLGLSTGVHTHGEVLLPYSDDVWEWVRGKVIYVEEGVLRIDEVRTHCEDHGLKIDQCLTGVEKQVQTWGIEEMTNRAAVRSGEGFPGYRTPAWGAGRVIIVDTRWLLLI